MLFLATSVVSSIMISRIRFIEVYFSICLVAGCAIGFCADTNNPGIAVPLVATARTLSANDAIMVTVYQEDELTTRTIIDKNGMVMLPLLGQVKVSGMTAGDATARIQQLYNKDYLVNPQVNLIVEHFAERRFAVLGQVQRPGNFDFPQNESMNLLEAIAIAGGYTRLGAPSKIDVRRIENGSPRIYHLNAEEMSKDSKKQPFEVLPDDIITVGERTF
jgi:polysaccharide biosynthesis/export protein